MTFLDYVDASRETAIYIDHLPVQDPEVEMSLRLGYLGNGLCDETGELANVLYEANGEKLSKERIIGEAGDVLWYNARLTERLCTLAESSCEDRWWKEATKLEGGFFHSGVKERRAAYLLDLSQTISGRCKKLIRGDDGRRGRAQDAVAFLDESRKTLHALAVDFAIDGGIQRFAEANAAKLQDRAERDVLKGDGDKR